MGGIISGSKTKVNQPDYSEVKTAKLRADDYTVGKYLAEGGSGKIHVGIRKSDGMRVALKFFGYVKSWEVNDTEFIDEMEIMESMNHVESVIRIYGYFLDTPSGLISNKVCTGMVYPVIVMEYMSGGPLFGRLNYHENVSEKYLAAIFKSIILSVDQLHQESFVHRDLKLDNIMYVDDSENSPVRIIDLGMSAKLNPATGVYVDKEYLVGTPGCYAPESLTRQEYSVKTDIWQCGCLLYMLLSGLPPFHRNKFEQITKKGYYRMTGKGWTDISESAKDLVHKILRRKEKDRLTVQGILAHPWMVDAKETAMDSDYKARIKRLALRDKMKKFFCENELSAGNAERQKRLIDQVPILKTSLSFEQHNMSLKNSHSGGESSAVPVEKSGDIVDPPELSKELFEFNGKLKKLKTMVVRKMSTAGEVKSNENEIDYDSFVSLMSQCHLDELCSPAVFNIFDIGNTGSIDPKEFLMTMIAFRPIMTDNALKIGSSCKDLGSLVDNDVRLYFDMFDITETGFIDMDELRVAVKFLLFMGSDQPQDLPDIEDMFNTIDLAKNGRIDFDEFKTFYEQLLATRSSLTVHIAT